MKLSESLKIQQLVSKIENKTFDYHSIDSILIKLREFSGDNYVFHEISNFIAHNKERNEGKFSDYTNANFLKLMFFMKYTHNKEEFDIIKGVPFWVWHLVFVLISEMSESECQKKFRKSKAGIKERIRQKFIVKDEVFSAKPNAKKADLENLFTILSSFVIHSGNVFPPDDFFDEFVSCLKENSIKFSEDAIRESKDEILMCVLLLLHQTNFKFKSFSSASISISEENGNLSLSARLNLEPVKVLIVVLQTNLAVVEWCSRDVSEALSRTKELPENVTLDENFKLSFFS
ncbi:hypothetical protein B2M27_07745 [Kluyvera intermedia]|uniref:Uncharacterized protein n=1 Tax=Kluyvera intermedia TaxID=61648 RepID=A0ABX3UHN2_KLUIN|nr:hypothetical protein [Kluyvera intermedia]ORJ51011.1 hypothetical protein B2M27_07745 [Kluyvera intermedia]